MLQDKVEALNGWLVWASVVALRMSGVIAKRLALCTRATKACRLLRRGIMVVDSNHGGVWLCLCRQWHKACLGWQPSIPQTMHAWGWSNSVRWAHDLGKWGLCG